jgi:hypothetical protein
MKHIHSFQSFLLESVKDGVITCDNCGWHWDIVTGGDDPYLCHKCDHNNEVVTENALTYNLNESLEINQIDYGNSPIEFVKLMNKTDDHIKNWFVEAGLVEKIINEAPTNDSAITKNDLAVLVEKTSKATSEEITFARYVDDVSNLAQTFIDLLKENGHEESMGGFFGIDHQTECLLFFLKDVINRPRPYQLARSYEIPLFPLMRTDAMTAAYPSGHALTAFVMSEYYARKYPAIAGKLLDLGKKIANSREVTGIHFPSDTAISKEICKIIYDNNLIR